MAADNWHVMKRQELPNHSTQRGKHTQDSLPTGTKEAAHELEVAEVKVGMEMRTVCKEGIFPNKNLLLPRASTAHQQCLQCSALPIC